VVLALGEAIRVWLRASHHDIFARLKAADAEKATVRDLMRDIDRGLLRQNLKLTFEQRAQKHLRVLQMVEELL
jgi:hypothetical protein